MLILFGESCVTKPVGKVGSLNRYDVCLMQTDTSRLRRDACYLERN